MTIDSVQARSKLATIGSTKTAPTRFVPSLRAKIPLVWQLRLARGMILATGIIGISTIAVVYLLEGRSVFRAVTEMPVWAAASYCGATSRGYIYPIVYGLAPPRNKTWDEAAVFALLAVLAVDAALFCKSAADLCATIVALGLALNISYACIKCRCWIMRCCEFRRTSGVYEVIRRAQIGAQSIEILLSLAAFLVSAVLMKHLVASALTSYFGHAAIRYLDQIGRFANMPWHALFRWRILVFMLVGVAPLALLAW